MLLRVSEERPQGAVGGVTEDVLLDYAVAAANSACSLLAALTLQVRCMDSDGLSPRGTQVLT